MSEFPYGEDLDAGESEEAAIFSEEVRMTSIRTDPIVLVRFQKLRGDAEVPKRGSVNAAGFDLVALDDYILPPGNIAKIGLGFATEMMPQVHCRIESRSGMALKGLVVLTGVIDADYRGEWSVILMNVSQTQQTIAKGDRVAQGVLRPTYAPYFQEVSELSDTRRGAGGFGSTGR